MARILLIDDEPRLIALLSRVLGANGFDVDSTPSGEAGLALARAGGYDVVVLDLQLPDLHGVAVLKELLHARPRQLVLVLSGFADVASRVRCLELGASDFVAKPFALPELVARVWSLARRAEPDDRRLLQGGRIRLDLERRTADAGAGPVALSSRELVLLSHLVRHAGQVCTRPGLLREVWGFSFDPGTNVVDACVRRLRVKLGDEVVETIRNVGYCVSVDADAPVADDRLVTG